jgi:hypothetical protein
LIEHSSQITYVPTLGSFWRQEPVYFEHYIVSSRCNVRHNQLNNSWIEPIQLVNKEGLKEYF